MAWGRPVVATEAGGLVDAVVDGETGVLVPPRDVVALGSAVRDLLMHSDRRDKLGVGAHLSAQMQFSEEAAAQTLLDALGLPPSERGPASA
jgi:glycosyltransferase involved in cell wall biosynthesis